MIKVSSELPPNIEAIKAAFPEIDLTNAIFTYGDTVYNAKPTDLNGQIEVHESVHIKQQETGAEAWWNTYLSNETFRINQEAEAYRAQYNFVCSQIKDRNKRNKILVTMCCQLTELGELTYAEASKLIYGN
jgi:hypothetical protein